MSLRFAAADGRNLAYHDTGGTGPVVLCLAGLSRNSADFADLAAWLAPRHRVLRLDARGRGGSDWAVDPLAEYTPAVEATDALALLDHLGLARAAIVGTSRGGILGMILGATARPRVAALVLNDVGPVLARDGLVAILDRLGQPPAADFATAAADLARALGAQFPDLTPAQWLAFARMLYRDEAGVPRLAYDPALRLGVAAALDGPLPDLWPLWDALAGLPILAIRGALSDVLTPETLAEMARRHSDLVQVTLPNRGHAPFLNEPAARAALDAFLAAHP